MLVRILAPRFFFFYLVLLFSSTNKLNTPNAKKSGNTGDSLWLRLIFFSQLSISHFILIWKTVDKEPPDRIAAAKWNQFSFFVEWFFKTTFNKFELHARLEVK